MEIIVFIEINGIISLQVSLKSGQPCEECCVKEEVEKAKL